MLHKRIEIFISAGPRVFVLFLLFIRIRWVFDRVVRWETKARAVSDTEMKPDETVTTAETI